MLETERDLPEREISWRVARSELEKIEAAAVWRVPRDSEASNA